MTEKEYNECVTSYADNVYRFILKNLRHEEDARDVVQTAFEKMWRNRLEVDVQKCKSYLFTVAYHQMIDHIRKVKRIQLREEFSDEIKVQNKPANNLKKILEEALERLSETQRSLVMLNNYEEWFVLYIDDELNAEQKKAVEEFIAEHPSLKDEFALMQRTQLRPEKIIFPGRESLYKRRTPVISVRWRIAAAAILLFVIATTLFITLNKK